MTITNCPRCGSMNITTASVCSYCGWSQFAQVTKVSTPIEDELRKHIAALEEELTKMKKYFRKPTHGACCTCQKCGHSYDECRCDLDETVDELENANKRIAELEAKIRHNALWQASEDAEERAHLEKLVLDLKKRIAELEGFIDLLVEAGDAMSNAQSMWVAEEDKWDALVKDWKERER